MGTSKIVPFISSGRLQGDLSSVVLVLQDSPHFKNEQRKQAQTDARIQKLRTKAKAITQAELMASTK